jgi:hypothetical protein
MKYKTNYFKYIFFLIVASTFLLVSCGKEDVKVITAADEVSGLHKVDSLKNGDYTFYVFKKDTGYFKVGYNEVYIQLKNNSTGKYIEDANLTWKPLMHMETMSHACPYSTISKVENTSTLYKGHFIFIMASDAMEYWEVTYNYVKGTDTLAKVANRPYVINPTGRLRYKRFKGSDDAYYYAVLVNPTESNVQVGTNDISAYLYKQKDLYTFNPVKNYSIEIDPRMPDPSMGNHTSPYNVNLKYDTSAGLYKGKLNLTMTGYWKINLIVKDSVNSVIKGDSIKGTTTASSIYFELEF